MYEANHSDDEFDDNLERMLRQHSYEVPVPETALRTKSPSNFIYISVAVAAVVLAALGWWKFRPIGSDDTTTAQGSAWTSPVLERVADCEDKVLAAILRDGERKAWRLGREGDAVGAARVEAVSENGVTLNRDGVSSTLNTEAAKAVGIVRQSTLDAQRAYFSGQAGRNEIAALAQAAGSSDPGALALLETIARDESFEFRSEAEAALSGGRSLEGLERVLATARDHNSPVRNSVLAELAKLQSPLAQRTLLDIAGDSADPARDLAVQLLARSGRPELAAWMQAMLDAGGDSAAVEAELRAALRRQAETEAAR